MVCYLCHWEVESNLFLLNRTILIFPTDPFSLPDCFRYRLLCCRSDHVRQWLSLIRWTL